MKNLLLPFVVFASLFIYACEDDSEQNIPDPIDPYDSYPERPNEIVTYFVCENCPTPSFDSTGVIKQNDTANYIAIVMERDIWWYNFDNDLGSTFAYYLPLTYRDSLSLGDDFLIEKYVDRPETLGFFYAMRVKDETIYIYNPKHTTTDGLAYWFYNWNLSLKINFENDYLDKTPSHIPKYQII